MCPGGSDPNVYFGGFEGETDDGGGAAVDVWGRLMTVEGFT